MTEQKPKRGRPVSLTPDRPTTATPTSEEIMMMTDKRMTDTAIHEYCVVEVGGSVLSSSYRVEWAQQDAVDDESSSEFRRLVRRAPIVSSLSERQVGEIVVTSREVARAEGYLVP